MRKKIVAGNWKMNNDLDTSISFAKNFEKFKIPNDVSVMIAPAFTNLYPVKQTLNSGSIEVIAQNIHYAEKGAFTGEISASMLKSIGVKTILIGHSERRSLFNETNNILTKKVTTALKNDMQIIFCIGEGLYERQQNIHFEIIQKQLSEVIFNLSKSALSKIILAYEPIWAIGTGETASPKQVQEMHEYIRSSIKEAYGAPIANSISILYGGSVKPENAKELFSQQDVDGGLIGGASLEIGSFTKIINAI